jgi:argininosuccinate synthase
MSSISELKGKVVAFAGSGGLDSVTIIRWMSAQGVRVVCFTADFAQPDETDLSAVAERMKACGAEAVHVIDLKERLARAGLEVVRSQAYHPGRYWNTTGAARHVLVKGIIERMRDMGLDVLSHGCTGRGNDQVRFQHITNLLEPKFKVYAPWRDDAFLSRFRGRTEMIAYCREQGLPLKASADVIYSTDANILGLTHEAGVLEKLTTPARTVRPTMGVYPADAPAEAEIVEIHFERGYAEAINGERLSADALIRKANEIAGRHGVGLALHLVENRIVGIKSRGVYEAPGMELLGTCHELLTQVILDDTATRLFEHLRGLIADQVYKGRWFDAASAASGAAVDELMRFATGDIAVSLYKGTISFQHAKNIRHSLYCEDNASMEAVGEFSHQDSEGYLRATGQSVRAAGFAKVVNESLLAKI